MRPFAARVSGRQVVVTDVTTAGLAVLADGTKVPVGEVRFPTWHSTVGLKAASRGERMGATWRRAGDGVRMARVGNWALEVHGNAWFAQAAEGEVHHSKAASITAAQREAERFAASQLVAQATVRLARKASSGVMVAVRPPEHICEAVVLSGEGAEALDDLHVTLVYVGKADEVDEPALRRAVQRWASTQGPLVARLSGTGEFPADSDGRVTWGALDAPGLDIARVALLEELAVEGIFPPENHGFQPHLTLAYGDAAPSPHRLPDEVVGQDFAIASMVLAVGGQWEDVALGGAPELAAVAILLDEPEPALPETYGADEDDVAGDASLTDIPTPPPPPHERDEMSQPAPVVTTLAKTALKDFSPDEQEELIREGVAEARRARNLGRLQLDGTHYAGLL